MSLAVPVAQSGRGESALTSASFTVPATGACLSLYYRIESANSDDFTVQLRQNK